MSEPEFECSSSAILSSNITAFSNFRLFNTLSGPDNTNLKLLSDLKLELTVEFNSY